MKRIISLAFAVLFCLSGAANGIWDQAEHFTFKHQKNQREYYLYIPQGMQTKGAPLIVLMHGYGGKAKGYFPGLLEEAERQGFAVCIPNGWPDNRKKNGWNVGYPGQEGLKTDDVDYICKLVSFLQKKYGFRKDGTFATGMSNGGEMCYLLAASRPGVFRAYASLAGLEMEWVYRKFNPTKPVPFMEVHGTEDKTSHWEGDPDGKCGWNEYISVPVAVGTWIHVNRCTHEITEELPLYKPESHKVILHRYMDGTDNTEVRLYEIIGGAHKNGSADMDVARIEMEFFKQYL